MGLRLSLAVLISGNGSNLQAIIDAIESGRLDAEIKVVVSNNPSAQGLVRARNHGLQTRVIDHRDYAGREHFDAELKHYLEKLAPNLILLAGFMRVLGGEFIAAFSSRILNIHPSLLPAYKGLNVYQRALDNGEAEHGVSVHLVTATLDDGPVIAQARYTIAADDRAADLERKGHALEHRIYPWVLSLICEQKLIIKEGQPYYEQTPLDRPLALPL